MDKEQLKEAQISYIEIQLEAVNDAMARELSVRGFEALKIERARLLGEIKKLRRKKWTQ